MTPKECKAKTFFLERKALESKTTVDVSSEGAHFQANVYYKNFTSQNVIGRNICFYEKQTHQSCLVENRVDA